METRFTKFCGRGNLQPFWVEEMRDEQQVQYWILATPESTHSKVLPRYYASSDAEHAAEFAMLLAQR